MRVSILIPAYNAAPFIAETLQSCVDQTFNDIEIIVVDDGSTDNTLEIAREWERKYSNIHVFSQPNSGACVARNFAFENSTGDYVMWLDADNVISPNKVEVQIKGLQLINDPFAIATCKWGDFSSDISQSVFRPQDTYRNADEGFDLLLELWEKSEMFETACYLISRDLATKVVGWQKGLLKNQDGEYFSRVLINASYVVYCQEAKVYYRRGDYDSVSKDNSEFKVQALLWSFILYKQNALVHRDNLRVRKALTRVFSLFMYLYYGKYTDLALEAKREIQEMGMKPLPSGTKRTKMISRLIGLENFLKLRKLLAKY